MRADGEQSARLGVQPRQQDQRRKRRAKRDAAGVARQRLSGAVPSFTLIF
jgi:hypothetical protein